MHRQAATMLHEKGLDPSIVLSSSENVNWKCDTSNELELVHQPTPDSSDHSDDLQGDDSQEERELSIIERLPVEVIAKILSWVAIVHPKSYHNAVMASRVFWIKHDSALIWEPLCRSVYPESSSVIDNYASWYAMFRQRPAIRFNGVYVSTITYLRQGEQENGSWYPPTMEVTYYRYLRFRSDGIVQIRHCNHPPLQVLPIVKEDLWSLGVWALDPEDGHVSVDMQGPTARYNFHMQLKVASSGGKIHNKLKTVRYWFHDVDENAQGEFSLHESQNRPYYFLLSS